MATSILQSVPILATLGAALWLGRSVGWAVGAQFYVGFFGVLVILLGYYRFRQVDLWYGQMAHKLVFFFLLCFWGV